jgi:superfamily II DNA/RNA helicase
VPPSFADLGVPAPLRARLESLGATEPFPVQAATLPDALAGRDVSGKAPTGSGKTLAFGVPVIARVGKARGRHPRALVLVPTRELASQVQQQLQHLASGSGRSVLAVYGGAGMQRQIQRLASGADVVIATPGRLADLVNRGDCKLDEVDIVVVDEADRMADMGFLPEVRKLLDQVRPDRQTLLFSATLDGDVDVLVRRYQNDPVRHEVEVSAEALGDVTHHFWQVEQPARIQLAAEIVTRTWPAIVFCRTKHGADRVARTLVRHGVHAQAIHGDRSQGQRERALAAFAAGDVEVLVATDVAARGIHVDAVACVVQLDPPATGKDYVHRSGRTGRAGAEGRVITFVTPQQRNDVRKLLRELRLEVPLEAPDVAGLLGAAAARPVVPAAPAPTNARGRQRTSKKPGAPSGHRGTSSGNQDRSGYQGQRTEGAPSPGGANRRRRRPRPQGAGRPQTGSRAGGPRQQRRR